MAITTIYSGTEYRSRLEAKWAAFFDLLHWRHTYEPFDGDGYIPDFMIHGDRPMLVEIKPAVTPADYSAPIEKAERGLRKHWKHDILILGVDPLPKLDEPTWLSHSSAGILGERIDEEFTGDNGWIWEPALWNRCGKCDTTNVFHSYMSYAGRPCGCHDGDHYLNTESRSFIEQSWAIATNQVKWRGTAA